ncbi:MAG: ORF6N domain-containing protein [Nitrosotalea sp.]
MQPIEAIAARIRTIRRQRVLLDADLAALYGAQTRTLTQAVRRKPERFPSDFSFRLTKQEVADLRSQSVISSWGGRRYPPIAFTEHGAVMAASVLNSPQAVELSVFVVRAFVQMREAVRANTEIGRRLDELESQVGTHDRTIAQILNALRELTAPPDTPRRRRIGFL